ncbi:E3 ubiquitin-protein ligase trim71 [Dissostichus eleginoides]|nr:E3 ubiquitin-protein ligase trim71 [Dissostichus eleginoides]
MLQMASFPDSDLQTCPLCKELCGSSAPISSSSSTSSSSSHTSSSSSQTTRRLHVLPCLHAFCRQCLEGQRSPGEPLKLRCPTCDQKVCISEAGVDSLPSSNFLFSNLLDVVVSSEEQIQNKNGHHNHLRGGLGGGPSGFNHPHGGLLPPNHLGEPGCSSCDEENPATSHCLDCQEYLCDNCVRAHQRVRLTKDHFIERLGENLHLSRLNVNSNSGQQSLAQSLQNNFALLSLFQDHMSFCQHHDNEVSGDKTLDVHSCAKHS